jgi:hypothetical protein
MSGTETALEGNKRPAEIMKGWYERDPTGKSFKFLMKRRLFFKKQPLSKDPVCQNLLYIQVGPGLFEFLRSGY